MKPSVQASKSKPDPGGKPPEPADGFKVVKSRSVIRAEKKAARAAEHQRKLAPAPVETYTEAKASTTFQVEKPVERVPAGLIAKLKTKTAPTKPSDRLAHVFKPNDDESVAPVEAPVAEQSKAEAVVAEPASAGKAEKRKRTRSRSKKSTKPVLVDLTTAVSAIVSPQVKEDTAPKAPNPGKPKPVGEGRGTATPKSGTQTPKESAGKVPPGKEPATPPEGGSATKTQAPTIVKNKSRVDVLSAMRPELNKAWLELAEKVVPELDAKTSGGKVIAHPISAACRFKATQQALLDMCARAINVDDLETKDVSVADIYGNVRTKLFTVTKGTNTVDAQTFVGVPHGLSITEVGDVLPGDAARSVHSNRVVLKENMCDYGLMVDIYCSGRLNEPLTVASVKSHLQKLRTHTIYMVLRRHVGMADADPYADHGAWYRQDGKVQFQADTRATFFAGHDDVAWLDNACIDEIAISHVTTIGPYLVYRLVLQPGATDNLCTPAVPFVREVSMDSGWFSWASRKLLCMYYDIEYENTAWVCDTIVAQAGVSARPAVGSNVDATVANVRSLMSVDPRLKVLKGRFPMAYNRIERGTLLHVLFANRSGFFMELFRGRADNHYAEKILDVARAPSAIANHAYTRWSNLVRMIGIRADITYNIWAVFGTLFLCLRVYRWWKSRRSGGNSGGRTRKSLLTLASWPGSLLGADNGLRIFLAKTVGRVAGIEITEDVIQKMAAVFVRVTLAACSEEVIRKVAGVTVARFFSLAELYAVYNKYGTILPGIPAFLMHEYNNYRQNNGGSIGDAITVHSAFNCFTVTMSVMAANDITPGMWPFTSHLLGLAVAAVTPLNLPAALARTDPGDLNLPVGVYALPPLAFVPSVDSPALDVPNAFRGNMEVHYGDVLVGKLPVVDDKGEVDQAATKVASRELLQSVRLIQAPDLRTGQYPLVFPSRHLVRPAATINSVLVGLLLRSHKDPYTPETLVPVDELERRWVNLTKTFCQAVLPPGIYEEVTRADALEAIEDGNKRRALSRAFDLLDAGTDRERLNGENVAVSANAKLDEVLPYRNVDEFEVGPKVRIIAASSERAKAQLAGPARGISKVLKSILVPDRVVTIEGVNFRFAYAAGSTSQQLSLLSDYLFGNDGTICIAAAGDDNVITAFGRNFEGDYSQYDATQGAGCRAAMRTWMTHIGVPQHVIDIVAQSMDFNYNTITKGWSVRGTADVQMPTGSSLTTVLNTINTLLSICGVCLALVKTAPHVLVDGDAETLGRCFQSLGLKMVIKERTMSQVAFLKGLWFDSYDRHLPRWWVNLPSVVLKIGKVLKSPLEICQCENPKDAYAAVAKVMYMSFAAVPADYPILGAFLRIYKRVAFGAVEEYVKRAQAYILPLRAYSVQLDFVTPVFRNVALEVICDRYQITVAEIEDLESLYDQVDAFPVVVSHPVLERLMEVDYM